METCQFWWIIFGARNLDIIVYFAYVIYTVTLRSGSLYECSSCGKSYGGRRKGMRTDSAVTVLRHLNSGYSDKHPQRDCRQNWYFEPTLFWNCILPSSPTSVLKGKCKISGGSLKVLEVAMIALVKDIKAQGGLLWMFFCTAGLGYIWFLPDHCFP